MRNLDKIFVDFLTAHGFESEGDTVFINGEWEDRLIANIAESAVILGDIGLKSKEVRELVRTVTEQYLSGMFALMCFEGVARIATIDGVISFAPRDEEDQKTLLAIIEDMKKDDNGSEANTG